MSVSASYWRAYGHPWAIDSLSKRLPQALDYYEYHTEEQQPYTDPLPSIGYEQGYRIPHWSDRCVFNDQHGTTTGYGMGCRCERCKNVIRRYQTERKASQR